MTGQRSQSISLASDSRGRIPFAMVGVLLLLTSSTVVFYLDTRPEPEPDTNTAIAMDRASASAQTAVSEGVTEAIQEAGAEPINQTTDSPVGRALDDSDVVIEGEESIYERFGPYVRLRIYLETQRNLQGTTQRIDQNTVSRASLPALSYDEQELETAISKVDLEVGRYHDDMESGTVKATVSGINVSVVRNGTVVANRTESVNVTTGTTVFALHERTHTYEKRLNTDFFDTSVADAKGFSQKFAKRLYPLVWSKAYTERMHPNARPDEDPTAANKFAFQSLVENHEAETLANGAIYSVQQQVFGSKDPRADDVMETAYACTGAETIETLADAQGSGQPGGGTPSDPTTESSASATAPSSPTGTYMTRGGSGFEFSFSNESFCEATMFEFGEVNGAAPNSLRDITSQMLGGIERPITGRTEEIPVELFAQPAFSEVTGLNSPGFATYSDAVSSGNMPDAPSPSGSGWSSVREGTTPSDARPDITWNKLPDGDGATRLHEITISFEIEYTETEGWRRTVEECNTVEGEEVCVDVPQFRTTSDSSWKTYSTTLYIEADYGPGHDVDNNGISNMYNASEAPAGTSNLNPGLNASISELIEGVDPNNLKDDIESQVIDTSTITDVGDFTGQIESSINDATTIGSGTMLSGVRTELENWLKDELRRNHQEIMGDVDNVTVTRRRLLTGEEPLSEMRADLDAVDQEYIYPNTAFPTPAHFARAELIRDYVNTTEDWIDRYVEKRNDGREEINKQLAPDGESVNEGFSQSLFFAREALATEGITETRAKTEGSSLLDENIEYRVDASPTYLSGSPVTRTSTPEVRPASAGPETITDTKHAGLAVRNDVWLPTPGLPLVPWPEFWFASANTVTLEVDGEYARFEVSANTTNAERTSTYRRQEQPVSMEIGGQERSVGWVEPVNFTSRTDIVVTTPGPLLYPEGSYGPGDRIRSGTEHRLVECTPTWGATGPSFDLSAVDYGDCDNLAGTSSNSYWYLNRTADGEIVAEEETE